jgi:hypothetical protein
MVKRKYNSVLDYKPTIYKGPVPFILLCGLRPSSSVVEHFFGKEEVMGPIPILGSIYQAISFINYFVARKQETNGEGEV